MFILIKSYKGEPFSQHERIVTCSLFMDNLKLYVDNLGFMDNETNVFRFAGKWEDKEIWIGNELEKAQSQERRFHFLISVEGAHGQLSWQERILIYSIVEIGEI